MMFLRVVLCLLISAQAFAGDPSAVASPEDKNKLSTTSANKDCGDSYDKAQEEKMKDLTKESEGLEKSREDKEGIK